MKKPNIYKFLYIISALLIVGFAITFGIDAYKYNPPYTGFAPLHAYALVRTIEFIVPSIVVFMIGVVVKNKEKKH